MSSRSPKLPAGYGDTELSTKDVDCQPLLRKCLAVPTAPEQEYVEMLIDAASLAVVTLAAIGGWLAANLILSAANGTLFVANSKSLLRLLLFIVIALPLLLLQSIGQVRALEQVPAVEYVVEFIWLFIASAISIKFAWRPETITPILIGMMAISFAFLTLALALIGFHVLGRL
jgi:hypothetical protein